MRDCPTGGDIPTDKENSKILPSSRRVSSTVSWMGGCVRDCPTGKPNRELPVFDLD